MSNNIFCEMIIKVVIIEYKEVKVKYKYSICVDFYSNF